MNEIIGYFFKEVLRTFSNRGSGNKSRRWENFQLCVASEPVGPTHDLFISLTKCFKFLNEISPVLSLNIKYQT